MKGVSVYLSMSIYLNEYGTFSLLDFDYSIMVQLITSAVLTWNGDA